MGWLSAAACRGGTAWKGPSCAKDQRCFSTAACSIYRQFPGQEPAVLRKKGSHIPVILAGGLAQVGNWKITLRI